MGVALYNDIMFLVIESCKVEETVCLIKKSDANEIFYSVHTLILITLIGAA